MSGELDGCRILLTRRHEQSAALVSGLQSLGAEVMAVAVVQLVPPRDPEPLARALARLDSYQWLVFTSANAVDAVADLLEARSRPDPPALKVASVGPATSEAVRARFPSCEVVVEPPEEFRAEGLLAAFGDLPLAGARMLLPASERGRDAVAAGLRRRGAEVTAVDAYGVSAPEGAAAALRAALDRGPHLVVFASPSAVEAYCELAGPAGREVPAAVIGPVTEAAAHAAGLEVRATAVPSTVPALVAAIARSLGR